MFREMRRSKQQLSQEECVSILKSEPRGVLAVLGDEGYPYAVPLDFIYHEGKLYFHGAPEGHKIDALKSCDKVSFCVLDKGEKVEGDWAPYFKSVIVFGRMRLMEDREATIAISRVLGRKYTSDTEEIERQIQASGARVQGLELTIEHMTGKRVHEK